MKRNRRFTITCLLSLFTVLSTFGQRPSKTESILKTGEWHKVAVENAGITKIDKQLVDKLGVGASAAANLRVFGNRGGVLPQLVSAERIDDLEELATLRVGLDDGSFDNGDYILFYAEGPDSKSYNDVTGRFTMTTNVYDTENHYFLGVANSGPPKEVQSRESLFGDFQEVGSFIDYQRIEEDRVNLLGFFRPPGSGKRWFGDEFSTVEERDYTLTFPDIVSGSDVLFNVEFAGRSGSTTLLYATINGKTFSEDIRSTTLGNVERPYAYIGEISGSYQATSDLQEISIRYPQIGGTTTRGWLDFIEMQAERQLTLQNRDYLEFRHPWSLNHSELKYSLGQVPEGILVWDITNPMVPVDQKFLRNGDNAEFACETGGAVREFVAFDPSANYPVPEYTGLILNQNVHAIDRVDLVIIYHPEFTDAVQRLAEHRRAYNGYSVETVTIGEIYNEFSGGSVDPTAIRDFAAMLHERDPEFRFMLLFGDATYDYRYLNKNNSDDNFVPTYETTESLNPIRAFPSDDYYALLDDNEGSSLLGAIDLGVGRIPVRTEADANAVVDKIIHYDNGPGSFGNWRLKMAFLADDEDGNLHLNQTEDVTGDISNANPDFNLDKIYLDAYPQATTAGGARYPDANEAINRNIDNGLLVFNYFGHGGHLGLAQERVLLIEDIQSWTNSDHLPIFITATCEFTGYDEPSYISAGEEVLLNRRGGAVALLSTVRAVYASSNKRLVSEVFENFFTEIDGRHLAIGEIVVLAKNSNALDTIDINARKFAIIGDPSMVPAFPQHDIALTKINGVEVGTALDTLKALDKVLLEGEVRHNQGGLLGDFYGTINMTVYDKPVRITTLGNDPKSYPREFENLSRVIFKGQATVEGGKFSIEFVVPKDISYTFGTGKISMYATDDMAVDAAGTFTDVLIGGSGENLNADNEGPQIQLFMNNESFVSGSETGPNPLLIVKLYDDSGINVTGTSIGHDLEGSMSGVVSNNFILNNAYEANPDDYRSGSALYPLSGLPPGQYSITVTAWDAANNFSEATIDFYVTSDPGNPIRSVANYPNPMSDFTTFSITHDLQISSADVTIEVFDVGGRLVSRIEKDNLPSQYGVIDNIEWSGVRDSDGLVGPGIYFYRAILRSSQLEPGQQQFESPFGKLVLTN